MTTDTVKDIHFPICGIDRSRGFERQPVRQTPSGKYARTTPLGVNVRAYDPTTNRYRGGQRAGLAKYLPVQPSGEKLIQLLQGLTGVGYTAPGGGVQTSSSGRVVTLVVVSNGNIKVADAGATSWTTPTGGAGALNTTGLIFSASNNQKLYFADGTNWKYFDPATNTVSTWSATAGTLPVDASGNKPRLIETWRGRTVLSGILKDPHNWFMSKVGDPHDFDYAPLSPSAEDAVAGNNSDLGKVGDVVTALVPFSDDVLFIGGDHTLWAMRGDPMAGGQIDRISDSIGMAWGRAWCKDPYGSIYFVSNRMGIYRMSPGQPLPQRISQQIEQLLVDVNTGSKTISMAWDDRFQGLHVFITTTGSATQADQHLFFEARTGAWWVDVFANKKHNPLCAAVFDGNLPDDRVALIGSWDGFVRYLDPTATQDDGYDVESEVWLGPLLTKDSEELNLKAMQTVLGEDSGDVEFGVYVGNTAEGAYNSSPVFDGKWTSGRNYSDHVRRSGHAVFVKIDASGPWSMEFVGMILKGTGPVRRRGI